jgi:hypothetical protein
MKEESSFKIRNKLKSTCFTVWLSWRNEIINNYGVKYSKDQSCFEWKKKSYWTCLLFNYRTVLSDDAIHLRGCPWNLNEIKSLVFISFFLSNFNSINNSLLQTKNRGYYYITTMIFATSKRRRKIDVSIYIREKNVVEIRHFSSISGIHWNYVRVLRGAPKFGSESESKL